MRVGPHRQRLGAVLEHEAAAPFELRRGGGPQRRGRGLRDGLEDRVERAVGLDEADLALQLLAVEPLQPGERRARAAPRWRRSRRGSTDASPPARTGCWRSSTPRTPCPAMCSRDCHWRSSRCTGAPLCAAELTTTIRAPRSAICVVQPQREQEVPEVVGREPHVEPVGEVRVGCLGHSRVRDQQIDRPGDPVGERRHRVELAQVERAPPGARRSRRARGRGRPPRPPSASRTPSTTSAPASARPRAVSTPMPDDAPVSTASRPRRSADRAISSAVVSYPNGLIASRRAQST